VAYLLRGCHMNKLSRNFQAACILSRTNCEVSSLEANGIMVLQVHDSVTFINLIVDDSIPIC
jgi:hypothetical protein